MSFDDARIAAVGHMEDNWNQCTVIFDDSNQGDELLNGSDPWIYMTTDGGLEIQNSLGGPSVYSSAPFVIRFKIYSPREDGVGPIGRLAEKIFSLFRAKTIANLKPERMGIVSKATDSGWHIWIAEVHFTLHIFNSIE